MVGRQQVGGTKDRVELVPDRRGRRVRLSGLAEVRFGTAVPDRGAGISGALRRARLAP